ncbi:DUF992 domain-containing protein [Rhodoblastus sp.]|uniref:DUF992 domain-containing protein n=1 Tax=Rhodoblastus sp. TaxID=1962975 RepID=UPI0035B3CC5D
MFVRSVVFAASVAALALSTQAASADQVKVGTLNCEVSGGLGMIVASRRTVECSFVAEDGRIDHYLGSITKVGVDIGVTTGGQIIWAVFAPTSGTPIGALAGSYGGVTGSVTVGVGLGANVLVGGSASTIALQPVSVSAQTGLNVAGGIAGLTLQYVQPPVHHRRHRHHH